MNKKIVLGAIAIPNFGPTSFCALLTGISGTLAGFIGAIGTIMIIVAGIFYLTSAGSPQKMETAKKTLIYAIVGLAIALSATAIIEVVKTSISAVGGSC
ncbi:MAG: TrbC/VirB2 family protein [Candidatus Staskawiczbacteria bacterium]|nr:TrbC/VirB2 family protein [Candidatus Staskawiczbacteria bacterium]